MAKTLSILKNQIQYYTLYGEVLLRFGGKK